MDRIAKALAKHDDAYAEVVHALFGDGADELIHKLSPAQRKAKSERTQAQVGLASNVVGLAAGIGGTAAALRDDRFKQGGPAAKKLHAAARKIPSPLSSKTGKAGAMLAGGALGLQVANIGGDLVANRVLARSAKKQPVKKNSPDGFDLMSHGMGSKRLIARQADKATPKVKAKGKKIKVKAKDGVNAVVFAKRLEDREHLDIEWHGEISKVNDDKQQVFGFASVIKVNGEDVIDKQGDYIGSDELEKAAYDYVHKSRKGGDMHRRNGADPHHVSDMIESMVFTDEKIEKMGLPDDFPRGWWVGYQIHDEDTWDLVKSGKRQGFSIHGKGSRVSKVMS